MLTPLSGAIDSGLGSMAQDTNNFEIAIKFIIILKYIIILKLLFTCLICIKMAKLNASISNILYITRVDLHNNFTHYLHHIRVYLHVILTCDKSSKFNTI